MREGVKELEQANLPDLLKSQFGTFHDGEQQLGGVPRIRDAFIGFQRELFIYLEYIVYRGTEPLVGENEDRFMERVSYSSLIQKKPKKWGDSG